MEIPKMFSSFMENFPGGIPGIAGSLVALIILLLLIRRLLRKKPVKKTAEKTTKGAENTPEKKWTQEEIDAHNEKLRKDAIRRRNMQLFGIKIKFVDGKRKYVKV